jgi:hypothetical protein
VLELGGVEGRAVWVVEEREVRREVRKAFVVVGVVMI